MNNKKLKIFMLILLAAALPNQCGSWGEWFGGMFKPTALSSELKKYSYWQKAVATVGLAVGGIGILTYFLKYRTKQNPKLQDRENTKKIYEVGLVDAKLKNDAAGIAYYEQALKMIDNEIELLQK